MMCSRFQDTLTVTDKFSELQQLRVKKIQNFELGLSGTTTQYKTPPPTTTPKFMDIASGRGGGDRDHRRNYRGILLYKYYLCLLK